MGTKIFKKTATLLAVSACLATLGTTAAAQETKVVIGMSGWTGFAPLTLAEKTGLFKKQGLDVEIKMIPQKDRHLALASKAIQCAATTVETHVAWNTNGVPIFRSCSSTSPTAPTASRCVATSRASPTSRARPSAWTRPAPPPTSAWPGC